MGTFQLMKGALNVKTTKQWMLALWMMPGLFCNKMKKRQLFVHKLRLSIECDHFKKATKEHQFVKEPPLVKLDSRHLLQILCNSRWVVGYILWDAFLTNWEGWSYCWHHHFCNTYILNVYLPLDWRYTNCNTHMEFTKHALDFFSSIVILA